MTPANSICHKCVNFIAQFSPPEGALVTKMCPTLHSVCVLCPELHRHTMYLLSSELTLCSRVLGRLLSRSLVVFTSSLQESTLVCREPPICTGRTDRRNPACRCLFKPAKSGFMMLKRSRLCIHLPSQRPWP